MEVSLTSPYLLLLLLLPLVYILYLLQLAAAGKAKKKQSGSEEEEEHGRVLKAYPMVGTLPHFIRNRHRFLEWSAGVLRRSPTHTMSLKVVGRPGCVFTASPANVEHVLKTNFGNYPKGELVDMLDDYLGHGIFNSDGEEWAQGRKAASHELGQRSLRSVVVDAVRFEVAERLLPLLERAAREEAAVDVLDLLHGFALDHICRVALGQDPGCLSSSSSSEARTRTVVAEELMHAFDVATNTIMSRFISPAWLWRLLRLLDVGPERKMRRALAVIHGYTRNILRRRRPRHAKDKDDGGGDLLSRYAASGQHYSEQELVYVVTNFILAGRDATSSALSWLLWLVSSRPDVEDAILREIREVRAAAAAAAGKEKEKDKEKGTFSLEELRGMRYLHAAITESMRLYPPVAINTRVCSEDDRLPDGTFVGKGWQVNYCPYAMARLEEVWGKDCEVFRPERWLDDEATAGGVSACKYPVFHAGPRMCLGKEMAYIQMKSIAACVYERFTLRYQGGDAHPGLHLAGTLTMAGGLPMRVIPRDAHKPS